MILKQADYSFNAGAGTIDFSGGFAAGLLEIQQIKLITNVVTNTIIYEFEDGTLGGSLSGDVLTLVFDTTAMNNSDELMVIVENVDLANIYNAVSAIPNYVSVTNPGLTNSELRATPVPVTDNTNSIISAGIGVQNDASIQGDVNGGTVIARLRGISKYFADVYDSLATAFRVKITNSTIDVNVVSGGGGGGGDATAANQVLEIAQLTSIAGEDFATQTTLALIKAKTDNLDIAISALRDALRGSGSKTLTDLDTDLATLHTDLSTLNGKDFATQTTLAAILAKIIAAPATEATLSSLVTANHTDLAAILAKLPALGQALAAASVPVVLTSAQLSTLTPPAAITGFATATKQDDQSTLIGAVTETAPGTDTASSGLNGRLQRIAQLITSLISALGSPFQAGGSIGNTSFGATQATAANLNMTEASAANIKTNTDSIVTPSSLYNGKTTVTTAGTRVVLGASQVVKSVTIKALSTNTGFIYVGNSSVANTNGFQLSAGDTVSFDLTNINTVNIDSSVNGEGVTYIANA